MNIQNCLSFDLKMLMALKSNILRILFLLVSVTQISLAQDIHFTMFDLSPLTLNPALIGDFNGTFRVTGNYRIQWPTIAKYTTPSYGIDAPLFTGLRKDDWISVSLAVAQDKSGESAFQTKRTSAWLGGSYHAVLNKKTGSILSLGVQSGSTTRGYLGTPRFGDPTDPVYQASSPSTGGNKLTNKKSNNDLNIGLLYRTSLNKEQTSFLNMGVSMYHLSISKKNAQTNQGGAVNNPKQSTLLNAHAQVRIQSSDILAFIPGVVIHSLKGNFEVAGQLKGELLINKEMDFAIQAGAGYRVGDAAFAIFGARYKDFIGGLAYDFNLSGATQSTSGVGGYELGVSYIAKIYKKPVVKPVIFCPRF